MDKMIRAVEAQDAIIRLQSEAIYDLYSLLLQHITSEEAEGLPVVDKINRAAVIKDELDRSGFLK